MSALVGAGVLLMATTSVVPLTPTLAYSSIHPATFQSNGSTVVTSTTSSRTSTSLRACRGSQKVGYHCKGRDINTSKPCPSLLGRPITASTTTVEKNDQLTPANWEACAGRTGMSHQMQLATASSCDY